MLPLRQLWAVLAPLPLVIPSYVGAYLMVSALGPRGLLQQVLEKGYWVSNACRQCLAFRQALVTLTFAQLSLFTAQCTRGADAHGSSAGRSIAQFGGQRLAHFLAGYLSLIATSAGAGGLLVALSPCVISALSPLCVTIRLHESSMPSTDLDRSQAALLALIVVAVTALFLVLKTRTQRRARYFQGSAGAYRPPTVIRLGHWRWPAFFLR